MWKLLTNRTLVIPASAEGLATWHSLLMEPHVHYLPLPSNFTATELEVIVDGTSAEEAAAIAARAFDLGVLLDAPTLADAYLHRVLDLLEAPRGTGNGEEAGLGKALGKAASGTSHRGATRGEPGTGAQQQTVSTAPEGAAAGSAIAGCRAAESSAVPLPVRCEAEACGFGKGLRLFEWVREKLG